MTGTGSEQAIALARRALARMELCRVDYLRALQHIARALHLNESEIALALMEADITAVTPPVREGFSGSSPYEIAQRYAAGDIDRDTMIRELSAWPYVKNEGLAAAQAEWDSTPYPDTPGTVEEVGEAFDRGLIDGDAYEKILNNSHDVPGP